MFLSDRISPATHRVKASQDRQQQIEHPLSRTSSLPLGIDTVGTPGPSTPPLVTHSKPGTPVQDENLTPARHSRLGFQNKAQQWRTSLAVTNSDYYSQWRPQISSLAMLHGSTIVRNIPNAPSLDIISEDEIHNDGLTSTEENEDLVADPSMFRYTPTRILEGLPSSRSSTPQVCATQLNRELPSTGHNVERHSGSFAGGPSIHQKDILPLYLSTNHENVYVLRNGCYIPLNNMKETGDSPTKSDQPHLNVPPIHVSLSP